MDKQAIVKKQKLLAKMLCSHTFTEAELTHASYIVDIIHKEGFKRVEVGMPLYKNGTKAHFNNNDTTFFISAIQTENIDYRHEPIYDYYIIECWGSDNFWIIDFTKEQMPSFEAWMKKEFNISADSMDCILYYLMFIRLDDEQRDNCEFTTYVMHNGMCLRATINENTKKYKLEPLHSYGNGFVMDDIMHDLRYAKPIYSYIVCPSCGHGWMLDESNIPDEEKYELSCKKCGMLFIRKKV